MRSCVLTYLYHFYCICIWSDCCTITWNSITYLHGLVNVFILYFMSFHNISVGLRSELWLGSSKKSHFMLEYSLLEWIFCLAFLQNPVWGIQLLDEICLHFCFQTLEKSPEPLMLAKDLNWLVAIVVTLNKSARSMFEGVDTKLLTTAWTNIGLD